MVAEETVHYGIDTPEGMEDWATTQVDGGGFMTVGPPRRGFSVSMFHQLHCLRLVRWALGGKYHAKAWGHVQHCLNYLRQDIICDSDVTLEPADILERDYEAERFGSVHICRNWEALYMEANDNWAQWAKEQGMNATG
jgi:Mycotoxin biosynthesis protein UstYa